MIRSSLQHRLNGRDARLKGRVLDRPECDGGELREQPGLSSRIEIRVSGQLGDLVAEDPPHIGGGLDHVANCADLVFARELARIVAAVAWAHGVAPSLAANVSAALWRSTRSSGAG